MLSIMITRRTIQPLIGQKISSKLSQHARFSTISPRLAPVDYSHVIIGGGVVGTAIASRLAADARKRNVVCSVLVLERRELLGSETSARNSGVIHAGLYFSPDSLRTKLCVKGKNMLYEAAKINPIDLKQCGKWIVAQNRKEEEYLNGVLEKGRSLGVCFR